MEPTAEMPRVVWEVLGRLDGRMRVAYHQCQDRSGTKISSLRVDMGNPGSKVLLGIGIIKEFSLENAMVQLRENLDKPRPTMLIDLLGNKDVATLNIVDDAKRLGWEASVSGYSAWTTPEGQRVSRNSYSLTKGNVYMTIYAIDTRKGLDVPLDEPLIEILIPGASFLDDLSPKTMQQISKVLVGIGIIEEFSLDNAEVQVRYDVVLQQPGWPDRIWHKPLP